MAEFKRQTFQLSTGKQIKLYGNSFFITKSLEIGEGLAPSIFRVFEDPTNGNSFAIVANPYNLTNEELQEMADYNIRLWMDLKDSVRKHGADNPRVFNRDDIKFSDDNKSDDFPKKEKNKASPPKEKDNGKDPSGKEKGNMTAHSDEDKSSKESITGEIKLGN